MRVYLDPTHDSATVNVFIVANYRMLMLLNVNFPKVEAICQIYRPFDLILAGRGALMGNCYCEAFLVPIKRSVFRINYKKSKHEDCVTNMVLLCSIIIENNCEILVIIITKGHV